MRSSPGYFFSSALKCSIRSSALPHRKPPALTASSMRGSLAVGARLGSRMISICSSVIAAAGEDVNGSEVLRQPQRVPHRSDIEAATDLEVFRSVREVQCHKDGVGNAFRAFALEVMLGHPETVVAKGIHERGHGLGLAQRSCKVHVRVTPVVDGRSAITDVVEVGMTGIEAVNLGDHREFSVLYQSGPNCRISN